MTPNHCALIACIALITFVTTIMSEKPEVEPYDFSNTKFATDLYSVLKQTDGNVFFSPYSLQVVLAMTYTGAGGNTAYQLQSLLAFPPEKKSLGEAVRNSVTSIKQTKNVSLGIANAMYLQKNYPIKASFAKDIVGIFSAELGQLDFANGPESAKEINTFVSKNTHGKIEKLFLDNDFTPMTKLVLVNAIYFKGSWLHKFDSSKTFKGDFHLNVKDTVQVDYMTIKKNFNYQKNDELKASIVELRYEGDMSMVLVVPHEVEGLKQVEEKISKMDLKQLTENSFSREINLTMPKFKLEQKIDLVDSLKKLGLTDMFESQKADFSGITDSNELYVSKAIQKAFIEVNEEGSEAAAATGFQFNMRMMPIPPKELHIKWPFLFYLRCADETVLMMGRLTKP